MDDHELNKILWDVEKNKRRSVPINFLIKRVFVYGGIYAIRYILHNFELEKLRNVFYSMKISEIGGKRFIFLKNYILS